MDSNNVYSRKYHECKRAGCNRVQARPVTMIYSQIDIAHMGVPFLDIMLYIHYVAFHQAASLAREEVRKVLQLDGLTEPNESAWDLWVSSGQRSTPGGWRLRRGKKLADAPKMFWPDLTWHGGHAFEIWPCLNHLNLISSLYIDKFYQCIMINIFMLATINSWFKHVQTELLRNLIDVKNNTNDHHLWLGICQVVLHAGNVVKVLYEGRQSSGRHRPIEWGN